MKIIVGLGNPGREYEETRHNTGFLVLDSLKVQFTYKEKFNAAISQVRETLLVKPQLYMNQSGKVVAQIINFYKVPLTELWLVHDDLDIRLGEFKIQLGTGPKVHNGVNSIETALGSQSFWRVRVGIDNRTTEERAKMSGEDYVLQRFRDEERMIIDQVVEKVVDELTQHDFV